MLENGYEDVKLVELTIEMLKGSANDVFYLSNEHQQRGLDLLSYEVPITHAFSLNFCPKPINMATKNMLSEFAELGSAIFLCRLYSVSEPTLQDYSYKDFDENNCGFRSAVSDLVIALEEELCMMTTTQRYSGNRRLLEDTSIKSHTFQSLLSLYVHCRHWWPLFRSIVDMMHVTFVQLRNGVSARSATCGLLQHLYEHMNKSNLIEMSSSELHSSSVSQWGSNRNTRSGRWKPHTNRWFDLFVCRSFESMLFQLLRSYVDTTIEGDSELVYPPFLEVVSGAVISTVADLQSMHINTTGGHTPRDLMNKRNSIIQALTEARAALHHSQLKCSFPPELLDGSPLFLYLTSGSAIKKVGLTTSGVGRSIKAVRSVPAATTPCVTADVRKQSQQSSSSLSTSFTTKRWFTSTAVASIASKTSDASSAKVSVVAPTSCDKSPLNQQDPGVTVPTSRPPSLHTLGSFPVKFRAAYSTTLVHRLRSMDQTVAALVNAEHLVLHQLRYLRDLYFLGRGSHYFADVRSQCEALVFSVAVSHSDVPTLVNNSSGSTALALFHSIQNLMVEAKPQQDGIERVSLTGISPLDSEAASVGSISRRDADDNRMTELILLNTLSQWRVELLLRFPMAEIVPPNTITRLNLIFKPLLQLQVTKWIFEFWWKAGVSSGLLSVIRDQQQSSAQSDAVVGLSTVEDVDLTVSRLKTNCTVGLNLVLRTVSTLLGHYVSTIHFKFSEVFESRLDSQQCLVREYATLLESLVTAVEEMLSVASRYIADLVSNALTASVHLRSALQLEQQHRDMAHNEPSYFSVVLCYRKAEEAFTRCRGVVNQMKKRVEESDQKDLLFKL